MPLKKGSSREDCISKAYNEMKAAGRSKKVAQAAALNHCNKVWGGIPMKTTKKELKELLSIVNETLEDVYKIDKKFQEQAKKIIQKAMKRKK